MASSDDESSDSSKEFLVDADALNFNSSYFSEGKSISNSTKVDADKDFTDSDDFQDVSHESNVELFSEVLKNLENSQRSNVDNESAKEEPPLESLTKQPAKKTHRIKQTTTSPNEINELLLQGESNAYSFHQDDENSAEEEEEEDASQEYTIPKGGVDITLPGTSIFVNKRKKGTKDINAALRRFIRNNQILLEKVGLLCWLAHGFYLNKQANEAEVMSVSLTLLNASNYPKGRIDLKYLEKFTVWFRNIFTFEINEDNAAALNKEILLKRLKDKKVANYKELLLLYITTLRGLGVKCRLIVSLYPPHRKLNVMLPKTETQNEQSKKTTEPSSSSTANTSKSNKKTTKRKSSKDSSEGEVPEKKAVPKNSPAGQKNSSLEARKRAAEILKSKAKDGKNTKFKNKTEDTTKETASEKKEVTPNVRQLRSRKAVNKSESSDSKTDVVVSKYYKEEEIDSESEFQPKIKRQGRKKGNSNIDNDGKVSKYYKKEESDSECEFKPKSKQRTNKKVNNNNEEKVTVGKERRKIGKLLSSDENDKEGGRKTEDIWAEVYVESEESWICVSLTDAKVHCVAEVYKKAKRPVLYVVAWNAEGLIKDVTRRYASNWLTVTRKQRIEEKWWSQTLSYWKENDTAISKAEDEMFLQKELEQPLPKTLAECKGHPLYVIKRHLLKYEGLYPPDCVPLGYLNNKDPIYSRHCLYTLCSRETWLKKARVVKPNQDPYKIVKALPKYDKLSGMKVSGSALELFGEWQTMEYEPPEAKDGIVPRNEYGNVDLFQPKMLPKGTVHIDLPALYRVAKKLNIDCAPAVVGFNFGTMGAVPAIEGYVVCEEYEDVLREAWETEQVEAQKRAKEKREKRVYGNWKRLIQGLIIRERLAAKYEFGTQAKPTVPSKRGKHKNTDAKKPKVS